MNIQKYQLSKTSDNILIIMNIINFEQLNTVNGKMYMK